MALTSLDLALIVLVAFVPALVYAIWIRNTEIHMREPFTAIVSVFLYGATIAIGMSFLLEFLVMALVDSFTTDLALSTLFLALVIAPFVEEFAKATGVLSVRRRLGEPENGLVYGAASGLGFAAAENVLYFTVAYISGFEVFIITAIARTLTSMLLHASASSIVGFGISRSSCLRRWFGKAASWMPYYLAAVLIHSFFNLLASLGDLTGSDFWVLAGLVASFALVAGTVTYVRRKIKLLDESNIEGIGKCE